MSTVLGEVLIPNRTTGALETGTISQGLEGRHLDDFEGLWWPLLKAKRGELLDQLQNGTLTDEEFRAEFARHSLEDSHWDWTRKYVTHDSDPKNQFFAIDADGQTQGLMMTNDNYTSRLADGTGQRLIYIDFLAIAPWNRKHFFDTQMYGHVGSLLMATAVSQSVDLAFEGRIGLHSLPQADGFYRYCGMTDLGPDVAKDDLLYFEMEPDRAREFLEE